MATGANREILELFVPGRSFVLTTHVQPDGDGVGSEIGLASLIRERGGDVRIINNDPVPRLLDSLATETKVEVYAAELHDRAFHDADAIIMLDSSVTQRLGSLFETVRKSPALKVCIDHHPEPDEFWDLLLLDTSASSTGEIVYGLYEAQDGPLSEAAASALYIALVSDTGRFRFRNASPRAFLVASRLVAAGARPAESFARLEEQHSEGFLRLYGQVLSQMETRADGRLVILRVPLEAIRRHDAGGDDLSDIINRSLSIETSRVAVLVRERPDGRTKVSLRSKGSLDVNRLARAHGGGGHANASGIVVELPLEETVRLLLPELEALAGT